MVTALVGKSILIRDEHRATVRYRLLETMREFGQDKLRETGQYPALRERHMRWYEQLVRQAEADWVSPRQVAWFGRLDREHANVQVALDYCLAEQAQVEPALRILVALYHFYWWGRSWGRERGHWFSQALSHPAPAHARPGPWRCSRRARWPRRTGNRPNRRGPMRAARWPKGSGTPGAGPSAATWPGRPACTAATSPARSSTCEDGLATLAPGTYLTIRLNLLLILAIAARIASDEQRATAWHKEMYAICEPAGECFHRAYALWALGLLALGQGDLDRAAGLQHQALRLRRGLRELTGTGWSLESLCLGRGGRRTERAGRGAAGLGRPTVGDHQQAQSQAYQHLVPYHDACEQTARQALGDQKFQAAWLRGRGLSTDDAITYALDERPSRGVRPGRRRSRARLPAGSGRSRAWSPRA